MGDRATKSGLALEAQRKIHSKYDVELAGQLLAWIAAVTANSAEFSTAGDVDNFLRVLKSGVVLCNLANALAPGSIKKVNGSAMAFKQMENISFFLAFAAKHVTKSELFQTVDLFEGQDPNAVSTCLASLARKAEKLFDQPGIGPKEAQGEKRDWSDEKLRAGNTIIGLQMGTNQCATASGLNMGNTRHM